MEKIVKYLEIFRNNALVRRHTNQITAYRMWDLLTTKLKQSELAELRDDWIHYVDNAGVDITQFGKTIKEIIKNYE